MKIIFRLFAASVLLSACGAVLAQAPQSKAGVTRKPAVSIAVQNAGFELRAQDGTPTAWITAQHAGVPSYRFTLDEDIRHGGRYSLRIENIGREPFGVVYQTVPVSGLQGKTLRFAAWMRTQETGSAYAGHGAALSLQAMRLGAPLAHSHMQGERLTGTRDWQRYEITLAIPADADGIEIGALMTGPGTMWIDDVELSADPG